MSQRAHLSNVEEILSLLDLVDHALRTRPSENGEADGFPIRGILVTINEIRQRILAREQSEREPRAVLQTHERGARGLVGRIQMSPVGSARSGAGTVREIAMSSEVPPGDSQ